MTATPDPYATFRPRRGRTVAWAFAVAALLVFAGLALIMPSTGYRGWTAADSLMVLGFGVVVAAAMWRFARIRAVPDQDGVVVRNVLLTRRLSWAEISRVRFSGGDAWAWLDLEEGDEVAVMAIQRSDGEYARHEAARLVALLQVSSQGGQRGGRRGGRRE
ncbi:PH domain-containing protein [Angustibacter sp. McL0619]|uniref:PH domain-containing protein n=1 Tax=Angustibacter sp. McL0619 TaxID=3415676 RepID=UPI003CFBBE55